MGVLYIKFLSRPFGNPFEGKGKIRKGKEKKKEKRKRTSPETEHYADRTD